MNKILNLVKGFFGPKYPLGAFKSPEDYRNITLASFQAPVSLPDNHETETTAVRNQGAKPKCTCSKTCEIAELYFKDKGIDVNLSDDDLYDRCKAVDGIPDMPGTYPTVPASLACKEGLCTVEAYNTGDPEIIAKSRAQHRLGGYAFVEKDYDSVCQAIYQNRAVGGAFSVDNNWFIGVITKVLRMVGRHDVFLKGFRRPYKTVLGQNSWGTEWIGRVATFFNSSLKPGHFEMLWADYENDVSDLIVFADIPKELLEKAKNQPYEFTKNLKVGDSSYDVVKLQDRLKEENCLISTQKSTGYFGSATVMAVKKFQILKNITRDGNVGPLTRAHLNGAVLVKDKLDIFCQAVKEHEGWIPNPPSRSFRNNNPGNCRYSSVGYSAKYGVVKEDRKGVKENQRGFAIFKDYPTGFLYLKNLVISKITKHPDWDFYQFFGDEKDGWAPNSDNNDSGRYAEVVASKLKLSAKTKISVLL